MLHEHRCGLGLTETGTFDAATKTAVVAFQSDSHWVADGVLYLGPPPRSAERDSAAHAQRSLRRGCYASRKQQGARRRKTSSVSSMAHLARIQAQLDKRERMFLDLLLSNPMNAGSVAAEASCE